MARSYSAREGRFTENGKWKLSSKVAENFDKAKADALSLQKEMRENEEKGFRNDRSYTIALNDAFERIAFFSGLRDDLSKFEDFKKGDRSMFEPPLNRASPNHTTQLQLAIYEMAKDAGLETGPRFSEDRLEEIWEKYGDGQKRETSVWWDSENRLVAAATGKEGSVLQMLMRSHSETRPVMGGTSWHNHPVNKGRVWGFIPSPSDIDSMFSRFEQTSYIGAKEGTYRISLTKQKMDELSKMSYEEASTEGRRLAKRWGNIWTACQMEARKVVGWQKDLFKDEETATLMLNLANKMFSKEASKLGLEYSFTPRKKYGDILTKV